MRPPEFKSFTKAYHRFRAAKAPCFNQDIIPQSNLTGSNVPVRDGNRVMQIMLSYSAVRYQSQNDKLRVHLSPSLVLSTSRT